MMRRACKWAAPPASRTAKGLPPGRCPQRHANRPPPNFAGPDCVTSNARMSNRTKNPQEGTMCNKKAYRWLAFTAFAALLVVPALAQAPPANPITCVSGTACKKSFVPLFDSNGGAATVKDSLMEQTGGSIHFAGGVSAVKGGTAKKNTVFGSNTSTADLAPGGS